MLILPFLQQCIRNPKKESKQSNASRNAPKFHEVAKRLIEITDSSGTIYGSGTYTDATDAYDTLCVPSSCDLQVEIYHVSPYGQCSEIIWQILETMER